MLSLRYGKEETRQTTQPIHHEDGIFPGAAGVDRTHPAAGSRRTETITCGRQAMKRFAAIAIWLLAGAAIGCGISQPCTVVNRSYTTAYAPLPPCICEYTVRSRVGWYMNFQDSCHRHKVGDTLFYANKYINYDR